MTILAKNSSAGRDYDTIETYETGIVLLGHEVKSVRKGLCSLRGSWAGFRKGELWLYGAHIAPYPKAGKLLGYNPERLRKLLATKKQLSSLIGKLQGLTLIPFELYTKGRFVKLKLVLGRRKRKYEKRETIKQRIIERQIGEAMRRG